MNDNEIREAYADIQYADRWGVREQSIAEQYDALRNRIAQAAAPTKTVRTITLDQDTVTRLLTCAWYQHLKHRNTAGRELDAQKDKNALAALSEAWVTDEALKSQVKVAR